MKSTSTTLSARALALAALLAVPGLAAAQNAPLERAIGALGVRGASLGLLATDIVDPAVTSQYTDQSTGVTHIYLRQRHQGVEVYGAVADIHVNQTTGKLEGLHSAFRPQVATAARNATPSLTAEQAVAAAARALNMPAPRNLRVMKAGKAAEGIEFNDGGISLDKIPVKLMYLPMPDGELRLVWDVTLAPASGEHYWNARVDAATGALLDKTDYTVHDSFSMSVLTQPIARLASANAPQPVTATANKTKAANSYNVWPITVESPSHGARQVVTNPADAQSSPFGWHDTNGVTGAEFTTTRGNNVHAYDDRNNANTFTAGTNVSPDGGANLEFDFPFNSALAATPTSNLNAAVVNLFYWNNIMHDMMARKGFDEVSGNFQVKNYSGAGAGNDDVRAEAQDASTATTVSLNNANFSTPVDGTRPRMQMYLWDYSETTIRLTAPTTLAGNLTALEGSIGRKLSQVGPISGNIVLVNDGTATPTLGCATTYANAAAISGNIALIERGECGFGLKVKNAQNAGAKMVIVMDNVVSTTLTRMGGSPDTVGVRIPSIFIYKADGDKIKAALQAGQTVSVNASGVYYMRDGDFDNGIIAHEYGHGISTRLTGGPGNSSCLTSAEQMGEGWSDYFGLWMTTKPGDVGTTPRGIGTYASFEPTTGLGIRPKPYSTNFQVNDASYGLVGTGIYNTYVDPATGTTRNQVHNIGYIWASTLWDLNWAMIEKYGYNENLKAATGGNNMAMQLVMDGLKLQPCNPGFLDGRDAILKADTLNFKGANSAIIWRVFARRGMGFSAKQGNSNNLQDQTAAFDLPTVLSNRKQLSETMLEVYPNPANNQVIVRTQVSSNTPVQVELLSLLGQRVSVQSVPVARLQQEGVTVTTAGLANGIYMVRLSTSSGIVTKKVVVQH